MAYAQRFECRFRNLLDRDSWPLTPVKGIPYLLQAAKILVRGGANVKVLIVGEGSIRQDLLKKRKTWGSPTTLCF